MKRLVYCLLLSVSSVAWSADDLYTAIDRRIPIEMTARERNQILYEMRDFLHGLHNIHHALARGDMKAVAVEAKPMGQSMYRIPANVRERLPEGFMEMSIAMREAFDQLSKSAETKGEIAPVEEQMAEIMTYCSGCHDTYRLEVVTYKAGKRPKLEPVNPYAPK
ncbi:MAG: cytochrome c [Hydrogenophilaceae bacterium]